MTTTANSSILEMKPVDSKLFNVVIARVQSVAVRSDSDSLCCHVKMECVALLQIKFQFSSNSLVI